MPLTQNDWEFISNLIETALAQDYRNQVTLKEYLDAQIAAIEKKEDLRHLEINRALETASKSMENRLSTMNEFREQLNRQSSTFITMAQHDILVSQVTGCVTRKELELVCKDVTDLQLSRAELRGKADQTSVDLLRANTSRSFVFSLVFSSLSLIIGASGWVALLVHFLSLK